ncbi:MBL fold metallo-hydrolase [Bartonella sp. TP]|uniref:MBL fold metallo-hydrolase n=1 Tax=Bartonella sp. TP TaxID=3057550 RepID=UPI0025B21C65|nr:MBL fold metallo-hydrolase [Bartonella sp. TP]MDN5249551.1 MBL fold metallo-hydrolase [Alphaproteobacteria bacterium]WJW79728.1 MBL fold metallo-hydrolase [Bartonella sp. TP]
MSHYVIELSPGLICETIIITPFEQNCRILWDKVTRKAVLIDPGAELDRIFSIIDLRRIEVEQIWITHGHIDHAGQATEAAERLDVKIIGPHIADKALLSGLAEYAKKYAFFVDVRDCFPDVWLKAGDEVSVGKVAFTVMHLPGHSPGHVAFYSAEHNLLISGDVLFQNSVGRTDLPFSNQTELKHSIQTQILPLHDDVLVLSGHGPDFSLAEVRHSNPFLLRWAK